MTVVDRNKIDIAYTEDNKYIIEIIDHLEWKFENRQEHGYVLQNKINDYLDYIASGQAKEVHPDLRPVIRIVSLYSYSKYCIDFLERVKKYIEEKDDICDIEWTHSEKDGPFNDGFSDDYVFEPDKIYPRIKKNWSKKPLEEVELMALDNSQPNYPDNLVMFRHWDSFIGLIMVDLGDKFMYFTYDMMPKDMTPEKLQEIAFDNLRKNIQFRWNESKYPGIFGIIAGGVFEAESILLGIWDELSNQLDDDLIISIPAKDLVFFTKLNDKKLIKKMMNIARDGFDRNRKESPYLIFCRDIFIYSREHKIISVSNKYSL